MMKRTKVVEVKKFHSEAEKAVYELLSKVINKHHRDLEDTEFIIMFKHGGWQSKGKTEFAKCKVLADDLRRAMSKDALMHINCDMWRKMSEPQRIYVLDHALHGLELKYDKHDNIKLAADGRPLLGTTAVDFQGYVNVVRRHGALADDIKRLALALTETNQLTFDDVKEEPPVPPREGLTVVVGADGVVEGIEDKNQLTIEEIAAAEAEKNDPMHNVKKENNNEDPDNSDDNLE